MMELSQIMGAPLFKANDWEQSSHFFSQSLTAYFFYPVFLTHHILVNIVDFFVIFSVNIFDVTKPIMKGSEH